MKRIIFTSLICLSLITFVNGQENEPEKILNAAIYQEEINGNLQEAIRLYDEIVNKFPGYRSVVAEALYRNGLANEKLGNLKARQYYEKVINNYSDQPEMAQLAQQRLNRILKSEKPDEADASGLWLERNKKEGEGLYVTNLYEKGSDIAKGTMLDNSSLSPDGTKMVGIDYSIGQNVAVYDLQTKQIQLITKYEWTMFELAYTYYPIWSPDGNEIAFLYADRYGHNIKISTLDGKTRTLIKNDTIKEQIIPRRWSQDGRHILAFQQDSTGIYTLGLVAAEGGSFIGLHKTQWKGPVQEGVIPEGDASFSPDGRFIVFADGPAENLDLFIMEKKEGTPDLLSGHPNNEYNPLWSPDGKYVVFIRETKGDAILYALEMADGKPNKQPLLIKKGMQNVELRNWTDYGITCDMFMNLHDIYSLPLNAETGVPTGKPELLQYSSTGSNIQPVWSHDGKYLAFITYGIEPKLVLLPADGGKPQYYNIEAPGFWEVGLYDLNWLPDNSGISFSVVNPQEIPTAYRLDLTNGTWKHWNLPFSGWSRTAWGPDMNSFIYTQNGLEEAGLFKFNVNTGESEQIFKPDMKEEYYVFYFMRFSRDWKKLACDMNCSSGRKILLIDMESGESSVFAENYRFGTFSPDGQKILADGASGSTIFSIEGEILHQYNFRNQFPKGTRFPALDWSPDGKQLVFNTRSLVLELNLMRNVLK